MNILAVLVALAVWIPISIYGFRLSRKKRKQPAYVITWLVLSVVVAAYIVFSLFI